MEFKTAVSILTEMMTKIGSKPIYEVSECPNILPKVFEAKVICNGVEAKSQGSSKKEAKQNVSKLMIDKLSKHEMVPHSITKPKIKYHQTYDFFNELQNLCLENALEEPILKIVTNQNNKKFVINCKVSSFITSGMGVTKHEAEQNASKMMIEKLEDAFKIGSHAVKKQQKVVKLEPQQLISPMAAISKCTQNRRSDINQKVPNNLKIQSDESLAHLQYISNLLNLWKENNSEESMNNAKEEFLKFLERAQIEFYHMALQTVESQVSSMLIIQLNTTPDIIEMSLGATRQEAEVRAMCKIVESLKKRFE